MAEPDLWRDQLTYHATARIRRQRLVLECEGVLIRYLTKVLAEGEPLHFSLMAGQPVYNVYNTEMRVVSDTDQPLEVYLDAARRWMFHPTELLSVGTVTVETFLIRIDFCSQPDFDTSIYNRLRLEHVLRNIRQSSPVHYEKLLFLYQFQRNCQMLLPSDRHRILPLEDAYSFLEGNPFF